MLEQSLPWQPSNTSLPDDIFRSFSSVFFGSIGDTKQNPNTRKSIPRTHTNSPHFVGEFEYLVGWLEQDRTYMFLKLHKIRISIHDNVFLPSWNLPKKIVTLRGFSP